MIFRYPEQAEIYHAAPVPLQVVYREAENVLLEHGIEPIIYRVIQGFTGVESGTTRRIEIMAGPFLFSEPMYQNLEHRLRKRFGMEVILAHRLAFGHVPERVIIEIPQAWADAPRVFLAKFGYTKGGNHV